MTAEEKRVYFQEYRAKKLTENPEYFREISRRYAARRREKKQSCPLEKLLRQHGASLVQNGQDWLLSYQLDGDSSLPFTLPISGTREEALATCELVLRGRQIPSGDKAEILSDEVHPGDAVKPGIAPHRRTSWASTPRCHLKPSA